MLTLNTFRENKKLAACLMKSMMAQVPSTTIIKLRIKVIQALQDNKSEPFFIAGGFFKPHLPFVAPQKYWDLYSEHEIGSMMPEEIPEGAAGFYVRMDGDWFLRWFE